MLKVYQKISQYKDNTPLFIEIEDNSFRDCMQVLDEFHEIAGLQINTERIEPFKSGAFRYSWVFSIRNGPTHLHHCQSNSILVSSLI